MRVAFWLARAACQAEYPIVYVPAQFAEQRVDVLQDIMRRHGLATLISMTADGLIATHTPLMLDSEPGPYGTLVGHLSKANPHAKAALSSVETLVIFEGTNGYISPSLYATKKEHGKVVPTWNYSAVHAYGTLEVFEEPERLMDAVVRLTDLHEGKRAEPWAVSDAPADFVQGMLRGIVGITMRIPRL